MKKFYTILATAILATLFSGQVMGQTTYYSRGDGNWNGAIWATTSTGTPTSATILSTDNVVIQDGDTVTVNVDASCASLTFPSGNANNTTVSISTGKTLSVSGAVTIPRGQSSPSRTNTLAVGSGTLSANSIAFTNAGGGQRHVITISTGLVDVAGNVSTDVNDVSATITFTGAGTFRVGGSLFSNGGGTITESTGTIEFDGSGAQTIKADTYYNLILSGGGTKQLSGNTTISNSLTLTNGILNSTSSALLIFGNSATVSGGSDNSFVSGPVSKQTNSTSSFTFPVGSTYYRPVTITPLTTSASTYRVQYFRTSPLNTLVYEAGSGLQSVGDREYWDIRRTSGTTNATTTLSWDNSRSGGSTMSVVGMRVAFYKTSASVWSNISGTAGATSANSGSSNSAGSISYTLSSTTLNSTNETRVTFASTTGNIILPVKFGLIKASEKGRGVQIDWTSYDEHYLANYQIERSVDGIHFTSIGDVAPRNVTAETQYGFFDALPLSGTSFYRIRNIDLDGKSGLSNIVKINLNKSVKTINVYPNPLRGNRVSFQTSDLAQGTYQVELINAVGMRVFAQSINHAGGAINQGLSLPSNLKSGQYTLRINGNTTSSNHPLIILQ